MKEIREAYALVCEKRGVRPVAEIKPHVEDLMMRGIVEMRSLTRFGIPDVPVEKLRKFLNGITVRVKEGLQEKR